MNGRRSRAVIEGNAFCFFFSYSTRKKRSKKSGICKEVTIISSVEVRVRREKVEFLYKEGVKLREK